MGTGDVAAKGSNQLRVVRERLVGIQIFEFLRRWHRLSGKGKRFTKVAMLSKHKHGLEGCGIFPHQARVVGVELDIGFVAGVEEHVLSGGGCNPGRVAHQIALLEGERKVSCRGSEPPVVQFLVEPLHLAVERTGTPSWSGEAHSGPRHRKGQHHEN